MSRPLAYFITFSTYGSHLHGAEPGSVDRDHNVVGGRYAVPDSNRLAHTKKRIRDAPYSLGAAQRAAVLRAIQQVCKHRGWILLAAHVRTNHVHLVVETDTSPERVMRDFKAYASRSLDHKKAWTRHGSTRYLWERDDVAHAVRYVVEGQGEPMAVFVSTAP
jgi:REP element-mobilizing transposase RayT